MVQLIFASFVATEFVDVDSAKLRKLCDEGEARIKKTSQSREGTLDLSHPVVQQMMQAVTEKFNLVFHQLGYKRDMRLEISHAWSNVGNNLHIDAPHMHPASFFSASLYLSDVEMTADPEECGGLKLISPAPITRLKNMPDLIGDWNAYTSDSLTIYPQDKKLVIFPSWLMHYVTRDRTNAKRYSIAFDTRIVPAAQTT